MILVCALKFIQDSIHISSFPFWKLVNIWRGCGQGQSGKLFLKSDAFRCCWATSKKAITTGTIKTDWSKKLRKFVDICPVLRTRTQFVHSLSEVCAVCVLPIEANIVGVVRETIWIYVSSSRIVSISVDGYIDLVWFFSRFMCHVRNTTWRRQ